jgi:hypothetical protein
MKTVAQEWAEYEKAIVPKNAGPTQVKETKRAFYGGCMSMLHILMAMTDLSDNDGADLLELRHKELQEFGRSLELTH